MKYKVGDRVKMRSLQWCKENIFNNEDKYPPELFRGIEKFCGKILTISDAVDKSKYVDEGYYNMDEDTEWDYYWTDEMIEGLVEEEVGLIDVFSSRWVNEFNLPEGYIFKDQDGNVINATKIVLEKKEKEYPKTYAECCDVLRIPPLKNDAEGYKWELLVRLQELLICRDAYWKIAGEEMGLGKPWSPTDSDYITGRYCIFVHRGNILCDTPAQDCVLTFPTEEMRDAFYENFKELIENCKELL